MARLPIRLAAILCLTLASISSSAQTSETDSLKALAGSGMGQQLRVDTTKMVLTDSFNRVIGLMDGTGRIQLLHAESHDRFGWLYNFLMWFIMVGLICLGIVIITATFRYLFVKKKDPTSGISSDSWKYNITKIISLVLLGAFVLALVSLFFVNLESGERDPVNEKWFEIFKSLLLLLGTSFTTIMGYFFGQAQSASLEKTKDKLEAENRTLNEVSAGLSAQIEAIAPMMTDDIRQEPPANAWMPNEEIHQEPPGSEPTQP